VKTTVEGIVPESNTALPYSNLNSIAYRPLPFYATNKTYKGMITSLTQLILLHSTQALAGLLTSLE
jgi:hypothetical protein